MTHIPIYLPPESTWYKFPNGFEHPVGNQLVPAPLDKVVLFARGGVILPTQQPALNTDLSRQNPFSLIIPPDGDNRAEGTLYYDDGDGVYPLTSGRYYSAKYSYANGTVETEVVHDWAKND